MQKRGKKTTQRHSANSFPNNVVLSQLHPTCHMWQMEASSEYLPMKRRWGRAVDCGLNFPPIASSTVAYVYQVLRDQLYAEVNQQPFLSPCSSSEDFLNVALRVVTSSKLLHLFLPETAPEFHLMSKIYQLCDNYLNYQSWGIARFEAVCKEFSY